MQQMRKIISLLLLFSLVNCSILYSQDGKSMYEKEETALVIIDIQYFYFPGGSVPLFEPEKASKKASQVLNEFRKKDMLVIHVRHNAKSGADIYPDVVPLEGEK